MFRNLLLFVLLAAVPANAGDAGAEVGINRYRAVLFSAQDYPGTDTE